jgi:hypothetical protein
VNYQKHYDNLINRAKQRPVVLYTEKHHIVPRCMGGTDCKENLVDLTPEEHFVAHQLLVKLFPNNQKLIYAAALMTRGHNGRRANNKLFGWIRKQFALTHSKAMKGKKRPKTQEHIDNHRQSLLANGNLTGWPKGVARGPMSEEEKLKRSQSLKGKSQPKNEQWRKSQSLVQSGKVYDKVICPHCNFEGAGNSMKRWHFNNCKARFDNLKYFKPQELT